MKKIISAAVLSVVVFAAAGQAQASFGNDQLTQVFYTKDNNKVEIGVDLGSIVGTGAIDLTAKHKTLSNLDVAGLAATKGAALNELRMGYYIDSLINTSDAVWDHYFATSTTTIPTTPNATKYSLMNSAAGSIASFYGATNSVVVTDPTNANAYRTKMNQGNTAPGVYANMNTSVTPGEIVLADMTGGYTDMYLWHFSYDKPAGASTKTSHLVAGATTDYTAVLRFYANGQTVLNPAPVPVPAAIWMLGSGLVGLIGLRRKQEA